MPAHVVAMVALLAGFSAAVLAAPKPDKPAARPVEIPFRLESGNIVVEVEFAPGRKLPFVFDSGLSNGNIVTTEAAAKLGLKGEEKLTIGDASGDAHDAMLTTVPSVRVGGATLDNQVYAIVEVPDEVTQRGGKAELAGFLGAPLMKDAVLCVDYDKQRMQRWTRPAFDAADRTSVAMKLTHELPTIVALIDGKRATLIVDSGNNGAVVVYPAFAEKNDFRTRYPNLVVQHGSDGGGQTYQARVVEADVVEIGPDAIFHHVPLAVIPQGMDPAWGIDGMIGFEVLSRLNPCLDRDGQRFLFQAD